MAQSREPTWTTRRLLDWTARHLGQKGVDHPRLAAEMMLAHVLETTRIKLYMEPDRPASELERAAFRGLVERAARQEPVDYLIGKSPFFTMTFRVTPAVMIPRPSTETLVEHVIQHSRAARVGGAALIADVGVGSGVIAVSLARHLTGCHVVASDLSEQALAVAGQNALTHGVAEAITFVRGDLLDALGGPAAKFNYLVSNPPYISDQEWEQVAPNVRDYEPTGALRGGPDGLVFIRRLIQEGPAYLAPAGQLVIEIAASQKQAVLELAAEQPQLANARVLADHEGLPRALVADAAAGAA